MRQRIMTRFRIKRYRPRYDDRPNKVAVTKSAQIQIRGSYPQGFGSTGALAAKKPEATTRGF